MPWYSIKAKAATEAQASGAEIHIYGDIGFSWYEETVDAKSFMEQLNALDVDAITVRINSVGGSVPDGIAIYNALRRHKASVTVCVDGMAMSIASLIAMAGDTVEMAENAILMVHAPWTYADGNSAQLRETADMLDKWAEAMATSYAAKTGKSAEEILALLTDGKDHYYTAAEAMEYGFIDTVTQGLAVTASADYAAARAFFRSGQSAQANPAAAAAQPPKETTMPAQGNQPAANPQDAAAIAAATAAAVKAEADRRSNIVAAFQPFVGSEAIAKLSRECENDTKCTVEAASQKLLAALGAGATPAAGGHVVTVEDERDKFRALARSSVMARAGLAKDDTANHLRGFTLLDLANESLRHAGVDARSMGKMERVAAAFTHGGSDFPLLLESIANKSMLKGYSESEETFQKWTSKGSLPDFKISKRVDLNAFPSLDLVPEGGEYHEASVGERGETVQIATYGKMFSITRQAIINDDLDAFSKIPRNMGRAAPRTVGNLVYAILTGNPKMADGVALFHANHKNLIDAAAPSTDAINKMITAMRLQKVDEETALNIRMAYLLCPVALEGVSLTVANAEFEVGSDRSATVPNIVRGRFEVISDARLDANSASKYYGAANPNMVDTIEVQYLDGVETPTLEQQNGWNVDGVQFKVRLDAGVKALDFRGLARNG